MNRAYATLNIKSVNSDEGIIEGIASTPATDNDGDVMEPGGAQFTLPLPLLWQHNTKEPIGHVFEAHPSRVGIAIKAKIVRISEPGTLKDRLDAAWHAIKHGLVRGLSIGFKGVEAVPLGPGRGLHYKKWSWLELSAVTLPANVQASITAIKSADVAPGTKPRFSHADLLPALHVRGIDAKFAKQAVTGEVLGPVVDEIVRQFNVDRAHHARLFARRKEIFADMLQRMETVEARMDAVEARLGVVEFHLP